ncbi:TMF-regulated nuclear protein 1 [Pseudopipra pipra]
MPGPVSAEPSPYRCRTGPYRPPGCTAPLRGRASLPYPSTPPLPVRSRCRSRLRRGRATLRQHRPRAIYPRRIPPLPLPLPMAASPAAPASRSPARGDAQRPSRGGPGGPEAGTESGGGGGSSSPGAVELAAARRRLVAAEGRRRAAAELEGRVWQVHCALRHAELRLAARAETLGRLGAGVAQAQLALAAQSQRLQKGLRRRPRPRPAALLAAARALRSCVPWAPSRARGAAAGTPVRRLPAAPRGSA